MQKLENLFNFNVVAFKTLELSWLYSIL